MGHFFSPLENQMDILQTLWVYDRCPTWMYTPEVAVLSCGNDSDFDCPNLSRKQKQFFTILGRGPS